MRPPSPSYLSLVLSAAALLVSVAGCSIPLPQAEGDPTRFYVLSTTGAPVAPVDDGPAIYLRQVEVANYLDARPLIIRKGDNEIEFREFARWGEPIHVGIGRVLREELLARGVGRVVAGPGFRAAGMSYDLELTVRVLACEGVADGAVNFRAVWQLSEPGDREQSGPRGEYQPRDLRWDGTSEASLAGQLSRAVAGLAAEIAGALKR
jgi:uncharacterized protein